MGACHRLRQGRALARRLTMCPRRHDGLAAADFARLDAAVAIRSEEACAMRPLRYAINITLDGCCDHRAGVPDEELHRYWAEQLAQADALLFGRVTYEMMEAAWRLP